MFQPIRFKIWEKKIITEKSIDVAILFEPIINEQLKNLVCDWLKRNSAISRPNSDFFLSKKDACSKHVISIIETALSKFQIWFSFVSFVLLVTVSKRRVLTCFANLRKRARISRPARNLVIRFFFWNSICQTRV